MNLSQATEDEAELLIRRMRTLRSEGHSHAGEIQEEAKRLVDWKEYVLAKPLTTVAASFLLGFVIVRSFANAKPESLSQRLNSSLLPAASGSLGSTIARGAITLATSVASSALKNYVSQFTQDFTSGREPNDRFQESEYKV